MTYRSCIQAYVNHIPHKDTLLCSFTVTFCLKTYSLSPHSIKDAVKRFEIKHKCKRKIFFVW
jgi:hypothetical protein